MSVNIYFWSLIYFFWAATAGGSVGVDLLESCIGQSVTVSEKHWHPRNDAVAAPISFSETRRNNNVSDQTCKEEEGWGGTATFLVARNCCTDIAVYCRTQALWINKPCFRHLPTCYRHKFMFNNSFFFRKSCILWDDVEKYSEARQATDDNTICHKCFACWTPKATNRHSDYVIPIAFTHQQLVHERASYYVKPTLLIFILVVRVNPGLTSCCDVREAFWAISEFIQQFLAHKHITASTLRCTTDAHTPWSYAACPSPKLYVIPDIIHTRRLIFRRWSSPYFIRVL
jgi:hypothetical protein